MKVLGDSLWQNLLKSFNIVTTSHKKILFRLDRDNVRYNSCSWHVMTVFIIENFFGECLVDMLNDQMFLKCHQSGRNDFRCVFVAFMQLLQEVQNYLRVSWWLLLLSPLALSYAERGKWKAERLDNGGRGTCRVSRGGSFEMLGKQKPIWMMIRQPSCRTEHERDLWILNYQALCLQQRCWETFPNIHNRSDSISFLQILFYYLRRKVLGQFTGWSWF